MLSKLISVEPGEQSPAGASTLAPLSDRMATLALGVVLASVFLSYLNTLWFQFVLDDRFVIVDNTWLRSWRYFRRYFTGDVWSFMHPGFSGNYYRPIFLVWYRLEYLVFGLKPWGWHFCTVLTHVAVTALVYHLAARLLHDRRAALFAALIFGLHPGHVEAVAWISGITEPMLALFLVSSFLCYFDGKTKQPRAAYLAASLLLYALAMLAKETALVLPMLIFASEFILSEAAGDSRARAWLHRGWAAFSVAAPYLLLSVAYMGVRLRALHGFQHPWEEHGILEMVLTWPSVIWFYIRHLFWPVGLGPFYDLDYTTHVGIRSVLLPALAAIVVAAGLWVWVKRSQRAALAALWLILPILPVLNLRVFPEGHFVHDRYLYLPSMGFAMLMGMALCRFPVGMTKVFGQAATHVALALALILAMGTTTLSESAYFADNNTVFTRANAMETNSVAAKKNLAGVLGEQGHLEEAIKLYQEVWPTQRNNGDLNYNLGYAYYLTGRLADADRLLTRAAQLQGSRPNTFFYLGLTKLKMGDVNAAAANVQRAIAIRPDAVHFHFALGVILKLQGNLPAALSEFRQEIELDPDDNSARKLALEIQSTQVPGQR